MMFNYGATFHHTQWSKSILKWLSYLFAIILLCVAAAGQGKEVQPLLISHEDLDSKLPSASELRTHFDLKEDDVFRLKTEDFFPKKLEKSFQKHHRWKFNVRDFSFTPFYSQSKVSSSVPITTSGNSSFSSSSFSPSSPSSFSAPKSSATFAFHENENYETSHNDGHEESDEDDDDDNNDHDGSNEDDSDKILNLMNNVELNDIARMKPKNNIKIPNQTQLILGTELMVTPGSKDQEEDNQHNYYVPTTQLPQQTLLPTRAALMSSNVAAAATGVAEKELDGMRDEAEMELFKISTKNKSENDNEIFIIDGRQGVKFPPLPPSPESSTQFNRERGSGTESLRIIPQLVNVTTENVYVSLESDEGDEMDTLGLALTSTNNNSDSDKDPSIKKRNRSLNSIGFEDQLEFSEFSSVTTEAPFITVNRSGIFPQSNLSSNFRDKLSKSYKRRHEHNHHHNHKNSIFQDVTTKSEMTAVDSQKLNQENSSTDLSTSSKDEEEDSADEDDEEDGPGKTMMMRRRPRRSVLHLYDMVVCATGCNPLMYKGYGCFCGFMGSGITVDGIDKCCYKHDWCYHHAKCPPLLTYFVPYYWTCNGGRPKCISDFRGWKGICGAHLCECDRQFAECLRKYPCPRHRAMCMTSPYRFWQNIVMPSTHFF